MKTLKDIAEEAGVSSMTVSNVIHNNTQRVSLDTIKKVNKIIKKYDYKPNMHARSLASNKSKIILLFTSTRPNSPFVAEMINCFEKRLSQEGYYLMVKTFVEEADLRTFLSNWRPDGIFFIGQQPEDIVDTVIKSDMASVFIDQYTERTDVTCVRIEDTKGAFLATEYLIKKGHKKIAFAAQSKSNIDMLRFEGYKAALEKYNIPFKDEYVFNVNDYSDNKNECITAMAKSDITAVFATSDHFAVRIMELLKQLGKKIPDDISIVGFDDIYIDTCVTPKLTTIHQEIIQKGEIAVTHMINSIKGIEKEHENTVLPVYLVERESVRTIN